MTCNCTRPKLTRSEWWCWLGVGILTPVLVVFGGIVFSTANFETRHGDGFDLIGLLLFAAAVGLPFVLRGFRWRGRVVGLLIAVVTYVGSYAVLSAQGGYFFSQSGKLRYRNSGFTATDCSAWFPYNVWWEPYVSISGKSSFRGMFLGHFYSPLLWCDRRWVHPTVDLFEE